MPRLHAELLESRDCPAVGSTLSTIGSGDGFTLKLNSFGRVAVIEIDPAEYERWAIGEQSFDDSKNMSKRVYSALPDNFDFLFFVNNEAEIRPNASYFGQHTPVKNDIDGLGKPMFDGTAEFGSAGRLGSVLHLIDRTTLVGGPSLHEMMHRWAVELPEFALAGTPGHWGFSSGGGQLGGFTASSLISLGNNQFQANNGVPESTSFGPFANGGNGLPYSPLELYLAGLIGPDQFNDPIKIARNASFVDPQNGIFQADSIQTLSIQDIIFANGARTPSAESSQKAFRGLVAILTPNTSPVSQAILDQMDTDVESFSRPGDDGTTLFNFFEATGGRATLQLDQLGATTLPTVPPMNPPVSPTPPVVGVGMGPVYAVGAGKGGSPTIRVYDAATGDERFSMTVFDSSFTGGVRIANGDFNNDGFVDVIVGTGPGIATRVRVLDGKTNEELFSFAPFESSFTGGVFVATGDVNGDQIEDFVVTPDEGGGPRVRVFDGKTFTQLQDFLGIDDSNFRGGARSSLGDMNNDGVADLLVAAGFGGGPRLAIFNGQSIRPGQSVVKLLGDFFVFEQTLRNGVFIASGDLDGDGFSEVIAGGGPGGGPRVFALGGRELLGGMQVQKANFFAGDANGRGGVRLATTDLDGDNRDDLIAGAGEGSGARLSAYAGKDIAPNGTPSELRSFDAFPGFGNGVFVG